MKFARVLTVALALAAAPALLPQTVRADEAASEQKSPVEQAIARVRAGKRTEDVLSDTRLVYQEGDADAVLRFVSELRARRGVASARALGLLAGHPDADVRAAVFYAIADVRLRVADGMADLRASRTDSDSAVRAAAYAALGAVGDAKDVPALIEDLESADKRVAGAATAALQALTGATMHGNVRLWRQWWRETQAGTPARLTRAWDALETGGDATVVAEARALVERMAWLDFAEAARRVDEWLDGKDAATRSEGYRLAAKLRLGSLAETVRWAIRFESDPEARRVGGETAAALGVAVPAGADAVAQSR